MLKKKNDGIMWMSWHDCLRHFTSLDVCAAPTDWPDQCSLSLEGLLGAWTTSTSTASNDGSIDKSSASSSAASFEVQEEGTEVLLHVIQASLRRQNQRGRYRPLVLLLEKLSTVKDDGANRTYKPVAVRFSGPERASPPIAACLGRGVYRVSVMLLGTMCVGYAGRAGQRSSSGGGGGGGYIFRPDNPVKGELHKGGGSEHTCLHVLRIHSSKELSVLSDNGVNGINTNGINTRTGSDNGVNGINTRTGVLRLSNEHGRELGVLQALRVAPRAPESVSGMRCFHNLVLVQNLSFPCTNVQDMVDSRNSNASFDIAIIDLTSSPGPSGASGAATEGGETAKIADVAELSVYEAAADVFLVIVHNPGKHAALVTLQVRTTNQILDSPFIAAPPKAVHAEMLDDQVHTDNVDSSPSGTYSTKKIKSSTRRRLYTECCIKVAVPPEAQRVAAVAVPAKGIPYVRQEHEGGTTGAVDDGDVMVAITQARRILSQSGGSGGPSASNGASGAGGTGASGVGGTGASGRSSLLPGLFRCFPSD